ncbi:hypothetical protein [Ferruginibacter sp.]|nr:hypothetical protein [Ferruginibacter sp.]
MDIKNCLTVLIAYLGLKFIDKFVEDNLPNLHYKRIIKAWNNIKLPVFLTAYIGFLYIVVKVLGNKQFERNFNNAVLVAALAIIADRVMRKKVKEVNCS